MKLRKEKQLTISKSSKVDSYSKCNNILLMSSYPFTISIKFSLKVFVSRIH